MIIATHDGPFHLVDVVGVAIASMWARVKGYGAGLTRTKDPEELKKAIIVIDIGGQYCVDGGRWCLDHHQPGGAGQRANGVAYTAAGLCWKHFGHELLWYHHGDLSQEDYNWAHGYIDRRYIQPIDDEATSVDLDGDLLTLTDFVRLLNPELDDKHADFTSAFHSAVRSIGKTLIVKARREAFRELTKFNELRV